MDCFLYIKLWQLSPGAGKQRSPVAENPASGEHEQQQDGTTDKQHDGGEKRAGHLVH